MKDQISMMAVIHWCFTYIDDVIDGIILAANKKSAIGHVFNLGYQSPSKMKDIVNYVSSYLIKKLNQKY